MKTLNPLSSCHITWAWSGQAGCIVYALLECGAGQQNTQSVDARSNISRDTMLTLLHRVRATVSIVGVSMHSVELVALQLP